MRPCVRHTRPHGGLALARHAALGALLSVAAPTATLGAQAPDTLTVATYAYPAVDRVAAVTPLAHHLGRQLGRPVRVRAYADPPALARAIRHGQVDVAVTNTFGYLLLAASSTDDAAPAAVPVATFRIRAGARSNYGSVLVARAGTVGSVDELRTRAGSSRLVLVAPGSTTGNLVPRLHLAAIGIPEPERAFRRVTYAGTHAGAFSLLRDGGADVAALATEEYERQAAGRDATEAWSVLWRSPDVPLGPVVVRRSLAPDVRAEIARHVVGLERSAPGAFAALRDGWVEARPADALVAADDATYDGVRRAFGDPATTAAVIARFGR